MILGPYSVLLIVENYYNSYRYCYAAVLAPVRQVKLALDFTHPVCGALLATDFITQSVGHSRTSSRAPLAFAESCTCARHLPSTSWLWWSVIISRPGYTSPRGGPGVPAVLLAYGPRLPTAAERLTGTESDTVADLAKAFYPKVDNVVAV